MTILFLSLATIAIVILSTLFGYLVPMMSKELKFKEFWKKCPDCEKLKQNNEVYNGINYWKYGGYCKKHAPKMWKNILFSVIFTITSLFPFVWEYITTKNFFSVESICFSIVTMLLVYAATTDIMGLLIPDFTNISIFTIGLGLLVYNLIITKDWSLLLTYGIGLICIALPLFLLCLAGKSGFGDVKLFAALGIFLGWKKLLLVLFIAVVVGAVFAIIKKITNPELNRKSQIPFGPFICLGTYVTMLFGDIILTSYFNLM